MPNIQFQFRRGTASQWTSANPTLASGELGLETDTSLFKIGNGATGWVGLPYVGITGPTGASSAVAAGSTDQVQYNNAGVFAASSNFVYKNSTVRVGIGTSSPTGVLDVCGSATNPVYLQAPVYSRIAIQDVSLTGSVTPSVTTPGLHYNITISTFSNIILPSSTTTAQGGIFWVFRNNSGVILTPTITNNANLSSNVSIPFGNSATIAISSNSATTFILF